MRILVSGATKSVRRIMSERPDRVGVLQVPRDGNAEPDGVWAADNGCFGGLNHSEYLGMLSRIMKYKTKPLWVTCPDVVGSMGATWSLYYRWVPMLRDCGLPVALVLQDGVERMKWRYPLTAHWDDIAAIFVGGSTAFKLSDTAAEITMEAHERGKMVHYGRVSTRQRIFWLARGIRDGRLWCDTFDGSAFSRFPEDRLPPAIRWIDEAMKCRQTVFAGGNC